MHELLQDPSAVFVKPDADEPTADAAIERAIDIAIQRPRAIVVIDSTGNCNDGTWLIRQSIQLHSRMTLIVKDAHLKVDSGIRVPVITNADHASGNREITIIGIGKAVVNGNASTEVIGHNGIFFYNVDGLEISGLEIRATAGWGVTTEACRNIQIHDLHFENHNEHPWQDGVHILGPSDSVTLKNLTGFFGDDAVAIDSSLTRIGEGGLVSGVRVENVIATNAHGCGLIRTIASHGRPVRDLAFTNMTLRNPDFRGGDAAIKIGWDGRYRHEYWELPTPEEHSDIRIENVRIENWPGAVIATQNPVRNLAIRNLVATHQGPLFINLEHDVNGLVLEQVQSELIGSPPSTLVPEFYHSLLAGKVYELCCKYHGTFLHESPGVIHFDHARISHIRLRDIALSFKGTADHFAPTAVKIHPTCVCEDLQLSDISTQGYRRPTVDAPADCGL